VRDVYDVKMTSIRWCALAAVLASAGAGWGQSEFWGELKAGKYAVGFRSLYQLDVTRSYDADYPATGSTPVKKPRPIFLAIWYPAVARHDTAMDTSMVYRDYFRAVSVDSPVPEFAQRLRKFTRDMACQYMLGKEFEKLTAEERVSWEGLLATPVFATSNAAPAAGKFPVVIYHPGLGGTFEDNAVAYEYLASHGYVVFSSAYQAADSSSLNIDGDFATSFDDLSFLLRYAATLPFADLSKVAAMGHSYGAQAVLGWRARPNSALDAVVFLDSTVEYRPLDDFAAFKAALDQNRTSTVPVILFADSRRQPRFEGFEPYLGHAARYELTVDGMEHNDFVSQGATSKNDAVRRNYEAICATILRFLDAHLKGDGQALASLQHPGESGLLRLRYKAPRPLPPTGAQVARMFTSEGPSNLDALSALLKNAEPDLLTDAADLLFDEGRKREGLGLLTWAAPILPKSALLRAALGEALAGMGDKAGARKAYEQALVLLPEDVTLDTDQKARVSKAIEEGMIALRK
jgi:tetratricopeptide (TPR) repeat protein